MGIKDDDEGRDEAWVSDIMYFRLEVHDMLGLLPKVIRRFGTFGKERTAVLRRFVS